MASDQAHPKVAADVAAFAFLQGAMQVLLVRRRYEPYESYWALPGGGLHPDETLEQAAERESVEETGWRPLELEHLGFSHPSNGLIEQRFEYFLASRAERVADFDRTETESIAWFAPEDVRTLIEQGEVPDGLSVTALCLAFTLGRL